MHPWCSLPPSIVTLVTRVSQLATEVLVVALTWWYGYRAYRVRRGTIDFRKSLSSLIVYNGSIYFLFLASLYTLDIIFQTASVPATVVKADSFMQLFYDPITSILVCHFMLSLRQFDSNMVANATSGTGSESRDHTMLTVLQFGARPSESLPSFIASFAHPVHVDWSLSETDSDGLGDDDGLEWREMDKVATTLSCPDRDHRPEWEHST
ncbi:hypothetical protein LXA43DRAFT_48708 [Ganoderma leucocontextum]|nr:hypothetical protein LXA43DRAFT_48708 [Ganoderma leucocontextum]